MNRVAALVGLTALAAFASSREAWSGEKKKRDRGEATMTIGGEAWSASSARFRIKEGTLRLSISRSSKEGESRRRESLSIVLTQFKGEGSYSTGRGSNYTSVAMSPKKVEAMAKDEAGSARVMSDLLRRSTVWLLPGAEIEITDATPTELRGTLSWTPKGQGQPIENGRFRAVASKKRKKKKTRGR